MPSADLRILVLSPSLPDTSPSMRFRLEQWAPRLERLGCRFHYLPFEDAALHAVLYQTGRWPAKAWRLARAWGRRWRVPALAADYDLIFLHREASLIGPAWIERRLAERGVPLVYDFDDPIWLPYHSPSNGLLSRLKCPGKTAAICRLARQVLVGNRLLAGWASQHNRNVAVVPSTIELDRYPPRASADRGMVTLGWTGSHSTLPFLQMLIHPLRRLAERKRFRLLVVSHTDQLDLDFGPIEVTARRWRAETEASDLGEMDIGLGPFPDTGWTPWRCHGKVLQYMAAGMPTVASRIGILGDYLGDADAGYLAASEDEWVERLSQLIDDAHLRRDMGERARQRIEADYSAQVWAPRVRSIFEAAASGSLQRAGLPLGTALLTTSPVARPPGQVLG
jgi:glycosyltransferase involved in cell wall biosynthesis